MPPNPAQIMGNRTLFDALALMTERNIHHLPVIDQQTFALGMVNTMLFVISVVTFFYNWRAASGKPLRINTAILAIAALFLLGEKSRDYDIATKFCLCYRYYDKKAVAFFNSNGKHP